MKALIQSIKTFSNRFKAYFDMQRREWENRKTPSYLRRDLRFNKQVSFSTEINSVTELLYHQNIFYPYNVPPLYLATPEQFLSERISELGYTQVRIRKLIPTPEERKAPYFLEKLHITLESGHTCTIYLNNNANVFISKY